MSCCNNIDPLDPVPVAPVSAGLRGSLQRMQLDYVDVVFANRPDTNTPMEGECGARLLPTF